MRVRKLLAVMMIGGLAVGSVAGVAEAAKKKKKKPKKKVVLVQKDTTYFINRARNGETAVGCSEAGATFLSVKQQSYETGSCGNLFYGAIGDALIAAGQESQVEPRVLAATDGIPFTLDATKDIVGKILVNNYCCAGDGAFVGAGSTTLNAIVTGTTGGAVKELGKASVTYTQVPGTTPAEVEFKFKPDGALNKLSFTALDLSLRNTGPAVGGFFYMSNSSLLVPQLVKTLK